MLNNPAKQLYLNMDIDNLMDAPKEQPSGLLSPKRLMGKTNINDKINEPAYRVAQHMKEIRKQREMLKNGN